MVYGRNFMVDVVLEDYRGSMDGIPDLIAIRRARITNITQRALVLLILLSY